MYNIRVKRYLNGTKQVTTFSKVIIVGKASPLAGKPKRIIDPEMYCVDEVIRRKKKSFSVSTSRTINTVYDIARSNVWEWFLTFTFNPDKTDSYDYDLCKKRLKKWIDNNMRRKGSCVKYLAVPEIHKSGRIHFHMLLSGADLPFVESGHNTPSGLPIYNLGNYRWGYTTAIKVYETNGISKYICKYITKEMITQTIGKRRYWASKNVDKPLIETYLERDIVKVNKEYNNLPNKVFGKQIDRKDTAGRVIETINYFEYERDI